MQQLRQFGVNFINQIGSKTNLAPDDELVSCKVQLNQLRDEIMMVKTQFTQYAHQVVEASEASVTLSKTVQQFYSEANHPGRSESVNTYLKVQEDIANRAVNTFHIRVQSGLLQELTDWIEMIQGVDQQIEEAQRTRMVAHETQNRLASLQSEYQEKKMQKGSSGFLNGFTAKNRESDMEELNDRITEAANARKSLYSDYTKIRNNVSQRVKQMMNQRFVQFDRIYVQMLECQAEYFAHSALTSKKFQRSIDYYRKQFPKDAENDKNANNFKKNMQQNGMMEDPSSSVLINKDQKQAPNKSDYNNTNISSTNSSSAMSSESASPDNNNNSSLSNGHRKPNVPSQAPPSYKDHQQQRRNTHDNETTSSSTTTSSSPQMPRQTSQSLSTPSKRMPRNKKQQSIHEQNFLWHPTSNNGANPSASHSNILDPPQEDDSNDNSWGGLFGSSDSNNNSNTNNNNNSEQLIDLDFKKNSGNSPNNTTNNNHKSANHSSSSLHNNNNNNNTNAARQDDFLGGLWGTPSSAPPSTKANINNTNNVVTATSPHSNADFDFMQMNEVKSAPPTSKPSDNDLMKQMNGNFTRPSYNIGQPTKQQKPKPMATSASSQVPVNGKDIGNVELSAKAQARVKKAYEAKMKEHNDKQAKVEQAQKDRLKYLQMHEAELNLWEYENTVRRNVRTLIGKLPDVLPKHLGWKPIPFSKLLNDSQLKKGYFKAIRVVHPDRAIARNDTLETIVICEIIFQALEQAYKKQFN